MNFWPQGAPIGIFTGEASNKKEAKRSENIEPVYFPFLKLLSQGLRSQCIGRVIWETQEPAESTYVNVDLIFQKRLSVVTWIWVQNTYLWFCLCLIGHYSFSHQIWKCDGTRNVKLSIFQKSWAGILRMSECKIYLGNLSYDTGER